MVFATWSELKYTALSHAICYVGGRISFSTLLGSPGENDLFILLYLKKKKSMIIGLYTNTHICISDFEEL